MTAQRLATVRADPLLRRRIRGAVSPQVQRWLLTVALLAWDGVSLAMAFGLAHFLRFRADIPFLKDLPERVSFYSSVTYWAVPLFLAIFAVYRLYEHRRLFVGFQEYSRVLNACTVGTMAIIVISFLDERLIISRGWLAMVWLVSMAFSSASRFGFRRLVRRLRAHGYLVTPAVIVGANEEGQALAEQFLSDPASGVEVVGFVDDSYGDGTPIAGDLQVVGDMQDLERLVSEWSIGELVVATTALSRDQLLDLYRRFGHMPGVETRLSSGLFEVLTTGVRVQEVSSVPLMTLQRVRITGVDAALKTVLDYAGAALGLLALSPVMLLIALAIRLDSEGPVFHRRRVLARAGGTFDALKFRTMIVDADKILLLDQRLRSDFEQGYKLKEDPRVTRVGRVLRRTSLDELPQLFNVLLGQMSLVGPRMITPEEAARYGKWKLNLLTVKPGITGPWQIKGRNDIPYEERVRISMHYIRNYTVWLDLEILLRTIPAVLQAKGAY